jgi:O-acetyl-ADP-ribose deacetylase (regulator of RNase III)
VAKFSPIRQGEVAVTSAGNLPVHYVFHAAAIEVQETSYAVSKQSVSASVSAALAKAEALHVGALWIPLMGTGSAGLQASDSMDGILEAIREWETKTTAKMIIMIFIYKFTTLEKHVVDDSMRALLSPRFDI